MNEHSKNFEKVKNYYDNGLWSEERVRAAVGKWITEEEAEEIIGAELCAMEDAVDLFILWTERKM